MIAEAEVEWNVDHRHDDDLRHDEAMTELTINYNGGQQAALIEINSARIVKYAYSLGLPLVDFMYARHCIRPITIV